MSSFVCGPAAARKCFKILWQTEEPASVRQIEGAQRKGEGAPYSVFIRPVVRDGAEEEHIWFRHRTNVRHVNWCLWFEEVLCVERNASRREQVCVFFAPRLSRRTRRANVNNVRTRM